MPPLRVAHPFGFSTVMKPPSPRVPYRDARFCPACQTVAGNPTCPECNRPTEPHRQACNSIGYCFHCADEFPTQDLFVITHQRDPYIQDEDGDIVSACGPCLDQRG